MKKLLSLYLVLLGALIGFTACAGDNTSDLQLTGNCDVTAITLDTYQGTADAASRTIIVRVPQGYDVTAMKVSALTLSDGAAANLSQGETLDMSTPHTLHVTNGNAYLDWTVSVMPDEARITSFKINDAYTGVIDEAAHTITVYVPAGVNLAQLTPAVEASRFATVTPAPGMTTDFTRPVTFTVKNNTAENSYVVTVIAIDKPKAVYVGLAATMDALNPEERTACQWMLTNVPNSLYASFDDIANGTVDLSECKVIWWHLHKDGGIDGEANFEAAAPQALAALPQLKDYYNNGGSFFFTRYATYMPAQIGAVPADVVPNNCWGQNEDEAETVSGPWSFSIQGNGTHPLFQNLIAGSNPTEVYTCDAGYRITNSTAQFHIGTDWGGYASAADWRTKSGAIDLGHGGDGAVVAWEVPAKGTRGTVLCIGSGCYDWYTVATVNDPFHDNVITLTRNAFSYLMR